MQRVTGIVVKERGEFGGLRHLQRILYREYVQYLLYKRKAAS